MNPEWLNGDCEGPVFLHELELEKRKLINQIQDMDLEEIELMKNFYAYLKRVEKKTRRENSK